MAQIGLKPYRLLTVHLRSKILQSRVVRLFVLSLSLTIYPVYRVYPVRFIFQRTV
ncbi:MAG: hypothetical protein K940chlam7_01234 [Chlamydiae bacterium]|nr:hypothetical protein [Chlamydiota bacterium]